MHTAGALLLATTLLTACGGGGGGGGGSTGASGGSGSVTALGGFVIDGYIEGATVCLDLNTNQNCDGDEPLATTGANGSYTLSIQGLSTAQVRAAHLLTVVPTTAKDADDGGQTLAQAGKAAFSLLAPASAYLAADGNSVSSAVISPLTTLVSHAMIAGNGQALDDAEAAVRLQLGLAHGTNLRQDFVATNNTALHTQAKVIASVIGQVRASAKQVANTTDQEALMAALTYLQQNITALQMAMANDISGGTWSAKLATALARPHLAPVVAELIGDAKRVTASTSTDIASAFAEGFYSGSCLSSNLCSSAMYSKSTGGNGQTFSTNYEWSNAAWSPLTPYSSSHRLTHTGWIATQQQTNSVGTYTLDGQGGGTVSDSHGLTMRFSVRTLDVGGRASSTIADMPSVSGAHQFTFAPGSKLYWVQQTPLADHYFLAATTQVQAFTSINDLIAAYPTESATQATNTYLAAGGDMLFTFDTGGSPTGGTVSVYSDGITTCTKQGGSSICTKNGTPTYTKLGTAPYEIKVVHGQTILILRTPSKASPSIYFTYSAIADKLYLGGLITPGLQPLLGTNFNQAGMNSVLSAVGKGPVLN